MGTHDPYQELIEHLNASDEKPGPRRKHRLPPNCYTVSTNDYFITICARHGLVPFRDEGLASAVIESLLWCRERHRWVLYCYCLMPSHLHLVLRPRTDTGDQVDCGARGTLPKGILDDIARFKTYTTRVWWKHGGTGRLWQHSSYDHVFRWDESVQKAVGYVMANPLRRGLVSEGEEYPFARIVDPWWEGE